jgi:hypothetical protein
MPLWSLYPYCTLFFYYCKCFFAKNGNIFRNFFTNGPQLAKNPFEKPGNAGNDRSQQPTEGAVPKEESGKKPGAVG